MWACVLLVATAMAAPACVVDGPSGVRVCGEPWSSATATPPVGTLIQLTVEAGVAGLTFVNTTLDGNPLAATPTPSSTSYSLSFLSSDTSYPWAGVSLSATLRNATHAVLTLSGVRLVLGSAMTTARPAGMDSFSGQSGVCVFDADDDGLQDVVVLGDQTTNRMWLNVGGGAFSAVDLGLAGTSSPRSSGCNVADVDGDGVLEVHVSVFDTSNNQLYSRGSLSTYTNVAAAAGIVTPSRSRSSAFGDLNGDGAIDLYAGADTGSADYVFINDGTGSFSNDATQWDVTSLLSCLQPLVADLDGDGDLDVAVANYNGANELRLNTGTSLADVGSARGFSLVASTQGMAVGDVDADGDLDIVVTFYSSDPSLVFTNNGAAVFTSATAGLPSLTTTTSVVMFDIENDGDVDVVLGTLSLDPKDAVMLNDGTGFFTQATLGVGTAQTATSAFADFDGDGDMDILHSNTLQLLTNSNTRPGIPNWIQVRPLTAAGADFAAGAVVHVACIHRCAGWAAQRALLAGSSKFSQSSAVVHFGLPDVDGVYNTSVRWAGDAYPQSTFASHPALGGLVPSAVPDAERVLRVLPVAPTHTPTLLPVAPWDGVGISPPPTSVALTVEAGVLLSRFTLSTATANGVDVLPSAVAVGTQLSLTYDTPDGDTLWPYAPIRVIVTVRVGSGRELSLDETILPGVAFEAVLFGDRGLGAAATTASRGVCMGDVDGDGDVDVLVAVDGGDSPLYLNTAVGSFVMVSTNVTLAAAGCVFGDFDLDGTLDALIPVAAADPNAVLLGDGAGGLLPAPSTSLGRTADTQAVALGDFDGDGSLDVFLCVDLGLNEVLLNDGGGGFEVAPGGADSSLNCRQAVVVDVTGDMVLDVLVANAAAPNELFVGDGGGGFTPTPSSNFIDGGRPTGMAVGDVTGDGAIDVFVGNSDTPDLFLVNDGTGVFVDQAAGVGLSAATTDGFGAVIMDADLDGDLDVVVGAGAALTARFLRNDGGVFVDSSSRFGLVETGTTLGLTSGDLDADGDLDILLPHAGVMYSNQHTAPGVLNFVTVRPVTPAGSPSVFGAAVTVSGDTWSVLRVIDGGSGLASQTAYDAHFGLPPAAAALNVSVLWPGGAYPPSNWTTHPGLGRTPVADLPGVLVVRPVPLVLTLGLVSPWDYAGLGARLGDGQGAPKEGDTVDVPIQRPATDVTITSVSINDVDVTGTAVDAAGLTTTVTFSTPTNGEAWPWLGLHVRVTAVDSVGLESTLDTTVIPGAGFEPVTLGLSMSPTRRSVCMADVDNDGDVDVLVPRNGPHWLWLNDGGGVFTDAAADFHLNGTDDNNAHGCSFGDADGDGWVDVFIAGANGRPDALFMNRLPDRGRFEEDPRGTDGTGPSRSATWGDVDGDGDLDLYLSDNTANALLINTGGQFTNEAAAFHVDNSDNTYITLMLDVEDDGDVDLAVVNFNAANELYLNTRSDTFAAAGAVRGFDHAGLDFAAGVADLDGNGFPDVVIVDAATGATSATLLLNTGGSFVEEPLVTGVGAAHHTVAALDIENDGDVDLLLTSNSGSVVFLNTRGVWQEATANYPTLAPAVGPTTVDIDGDGGVDLFSASAGLLRSFATVEDSGWVAVRPLAASGAATAFGATVRVVCADLSWAALRVTDGGSGFSAQSGYDAHFGLPDVDATYNVTVRWPGDATPMSTHHTHPALGGIQPSAVDAAGRLFIVRPAPAVVVVSPVTPWGGADPPPTGAKVTVGFTGGPGFAPDLTLLAAAVNGQDVLGTFVRVDGGASYTVEYATVAADRLWPWRGLSVEVTTVDSAGLVSHVTAGLTPGAVMVAVTAPFTGIVDAHGTCMGDVDGDGDVDIVVATSHGTDATHLFLNGGDGSFTASPSWAPGDAARGCNMLDADGDGVMDVFVSRVLPAGNGLYVGAGGGAFSAPHGVPNPPVGDVRGAAFGDIDGDGDVDGVIAVAGATRPLVLVNDGVGVFSDVEGWTVATEAVSRMQAVLADVDGDGWLDAVLACFGSTNELLLNGGGGAFTSVGATRGFAGFSRGTVGAAVFDADGDGWLDIAFAEEDGAGLQLMMNTGGAVFAALEVDVGRGVTSRSVVPLDWELDGDVDIVVGGVGGTTAAVFLNDGGAVYHDATAGTGVDTAAGAGSAVGDVDGDGDFELFLPEGGVLYINANARPELPSVLSVTPLTANLAPSAFGAVVRLTCGDGYNATRLVDGGSSYLSQSAYGASFAVPDAAPSCDVTVVFAGGATHSPATDPSLGGIVVGGLPPAQRTRTVVDRPYLVDVVATVVYPTGVDLLPTNSTITVLLVAGQGRADLHPADDCCFVNGVQTRESFRNVTGGQYALTYVSSGNDSQWGTDALTVSAPLQAGGVASVPLVWTVASPPGDPIPPDVQLSCAPGPASANVWEPLCVSCPEESSCTFSYTVTVGASTPRTAPVPPSNMTSATSADIFVGPFSDNDEVVAVVTATDAAGNVASSAGVEWRVDTSSPVTTLLTRPDPVSRFDDATFAFSCSEAKCAYIVSFNGGPPSVLGGNATTDAPQAPVVHTAFAAGGAPARVSNVSAFYLGFHLNTSLPFANASIHASLDGGDTWVLPVLDGNTTARVWVENLTDATHTITARAQGDSVTEASPLVFEFVVDTHPPAAVVLRAPGDGEPSDTPLVVVAADEPNCHLSWRAAAADDVGAEPWTLSLSGVLPVGGVIGGVRHAVEVHAVDAAGNVGEAVVMSWMPTACPAAVPAVRIAVGEAVGDGDFFAGFEVEGGVAWDTFEYKLNTSAVWTQTATPFVALTDNPPGHHVVLVRAAVPAACDVPLAASRPPPAAAAWVQYPSPPVQVTIVTAPPPSTSDVFAELVVALSAPLAWPRYKLDDDVAWTPCETTVRLGPLSAGAHRIVFQGVDADGGNAGDVEGHTWEVTSASDSSVFLSNLPDGGHSLTVFATDEAGSTEVSPKTHVWRVDTTPPHTTARLVSPPFSKSRTAVVDVGCGAEEDPCLFCWEGDAIPNGCSHNTTLTLVADTDGAHTVSIAAKDTADWPDLSPSVVSYTVDATPPVTTVEDVGGVLVPAPAGVPADWLLASTNLTLNATADEAVVGFHVSLYNTQLGGLQPGPLLAFPNLLSVPTPITVAAEDLAGNKAAPVSLRVLVDVAPPDTTITAVPASPSPLDTVAVAVVAEDVINGGGVGSITVWLAGVGVSEARTVDGGAGTATFTGLASGVYNVSAAAWDVAGNEDPTPAAEVVVLDLTPPASRFLAPPPSVVGAPGFEVSVGADEAASVAARLVPAGGAPGPWTPANGTRVVFTGVADGEYVVELQAVDVAGNVEGGPFVGRGVVVDTVAPVLAWVTPPPLYSNLPSARGCWRVSDGLAVNVSVTPPPPTTAVNASCVDVSATGDGRVVGTVAAMDAAGNVAPPLTLNWTLDTVPPSTVVVSTISDTPSCGDVGGVVVCDALDGAAVHVTCVDPPSAVPVSPCQPRAAVVVVESTTGVCSAGRRLAALQAVDGPTGLPVASDGTYEVVLQAADVAGNVEATNTTLAWHVDTQPPGLAPTLVQTPAATEASTTALFVVQLTGDDSPGQSRFVYSLDDKPEADVVNLPSPNTAPVLLELAGLDSGNRKVEVWAVDQAGNKGPLAVYTWRIVTEAPPVVMLDQPAAVSGDVSPTFAFAARWAGNDSEPAAGVQVSLGDGFQTVCEDTVGSGGVCVWNASLAESGVDTYTLSARAVLAGVFGDPVTHTWQYTVCGDDEFAVIGASFSIVCEACPVGGNCEGGLTGQAEIAAVRGFWAPEGSSGLRFYECPVEEACLPGGDVVVGNETVRVVGQCAVGYTGTLCGVCEDGFFEQFGLCVSCGAESGVAWVIMFAVLVAVIGVGVLFFKFRDLLPVDLLKVTLSMVQIIASANTAYAIPWPPLFADFLNTMRVFLIEAVSLTRANCAQPMTFYGSLVVTLVGFKVVLLVVVLGPVALHKCKHRAPPTPAAAPSAGPRRARRRSSVMQSMAAAVHAAQAVDWAKIFKITFLFLFVAYPGVSLKIMTIFKCVEVEGESWLVADMRLKCYEGEWFGYALYAVVMGCLYTGGLPLATVVILWRNRERLGEEEVVAKWGFLYEGYGVGAYLWEACELLRKLWLSALVVLMEEGSPLQVTVAVLISGWAHVLHAVYKPWRGVGTGGTKVYVLQHGSLLVTFFVFLMGLLFKVEGVDQDGTTYNFLAWTMLLACVGFLVAAVALLVAATLARLRQNRVLGKPPAASPLPVARHRSGAEPSVVRSPGLIGAWTENPLPNVTKGRKESVH